MSLTNFHRPLDVSDPTTFDLWCDTPEHDTRTLEEFAAEGGYPVPPSNETVGQMFARMTFHGFPPYPGYIDTGFLRSSLSSKR